MEPMDEYDGSLGYEVRNERELPIPVNTRFTVQRAPPDETPKVFKEDSSYIVCAYEPQEQNTKMGYSCNYFPSAIGDPKNLLASLTKGNGMPSPYNNKFKNKNPWK